MTPTNFALHYHLVICSDLNGSFSYLSLAYPHDLISRRSIFSVIKWPRFATVNQGPVCKTVENAVKDWRRDVCLLGRGSRDDWRKFSVARLRRPCECECDLLQTAESDRASTESLRTSTTLAAIRAPAATAPRLIDNQTRLLADS